MRIKKDEKEQFAFTTIEMCGVISQKGDYTVELRYGSWGTNPPKYDLRKWKHTEVGEESQRGITLSGEELESLGTLISKMMEDGDENDD